MQDEAGSLALTVLFVAGLLSGGFYGLAPVCAARHGFSTSPGPDVRLAHEQRHAAQGVP